MCTNQFNTNQEKAAKDDGIAELVSQNAAESDVDKKAPAVAIAAELASVNHAIALSKRNVCVCFWPPVTKWGTVMHEIPISSPPLDDIPSIP